MEYIQSHKYDDACAFCLAISQQDGPQNLIIHRGRKAFLILNRYPYTSGHLMVVPYDHKPSLEELDTETRVEIIEMANRTIPVLRAIYHPHGFNLGINIGEAAGAGILEHVHLHVVPRWSGDTNFMSALGNTRVLPETLEETYQRFLEAWRVFSSQ
jgi:ATP adenylyltransferase